MHIEAVVRKVEIVKMVRISNGAFFTVDNQFINTDLH